MRGGGVELVVMTLEHSYAVMDSPCKKQTRGSFRVAGAIALGSCGGEQPAADARIVVKNTAGRAVIERSPFALRFEDADGHTVLALAGAARSLGNTLYAPLGLSLGDEPELAYPVLPGQPDTNPATPEPAQRFTAGKILEATQDAAGAVVKLATDDPGGRTLTLRVAPEGDGAFAVQLDASGGASAISATFASGTDEAFHGFGGRREGTDLRGAYIRNWVLDYRYPDVSPAYYYVEPLLVSSRGYGLLLDQPENAVFRLDADADDAWRLAVRGPQAKVVVSPQQAAGAIGALTAITGRHRAPPAWSLGATISRAVQAGKTTAEYQQAIANDLDRIQADGLPVTAYCFEGWALLPDAFVASTIATLKARGIHAVLYIRSFVEKDIGGTQLPGDYDDALAKGYVATTTTGDPYLAPGPFPGTMAVIDFTSAGARAWWKAHVRAMLDRGADGFMDDFGEQVLSDMVFADGTTGATTHNRYPVLQHQATREAIDDFLKDNPGREIYFFTRAGYTGRPGSAAYENATFPGDELNDWSKLAGLPSIIPDMLNRSIGGAYGFTTDIAGYADFGFAPSTKELYARWSEAAALTPFFRVHNGPLTGPRMPWSYDAETEAIWLAMAKLHESLQPAFLGAWDEATKTGMPVIRPLWLVDPGSAATPHNDDEWLVGADLLAAPVVEEGKTQREVWLPAGCWRAHGAGADLTGGAAITVDAPLGELPWFQRCPAK
jgi:alpha-glucosidase (family GH31 glycosyl hydrolase)